MRGWSRRRFLGATAVLGAGPVLQIVLGCADPEDGGAVHEERVELAGFDFPDPESARTVGREALAHLPEPRDADALLELVAPERGAAALQSEIRAQYRADETIALRRWRLALTEARLLALLAS